MKELIIIIIIISIVGYLVYKCNHNKPDDDEDEDDIIFNAILNGESEVPSTSSQATGIATLIFDDITKIFTMTVDYSDLVLTGAHIHIGAAGIAGPVVFPLDHTINPIVYTSIALTPEQEAELKANLYYVNLHTVLYPAGEIRGQLVY